MSDGREVARGYKGVPKGSIVITPEDAFTGSATVFLAIMPWFEYDGKGYYVIPGDIATPQELTVEIARRFKENSK